MTDAPKPLPYPTNWKLLLDLEPASAKPVRIIGTLRLVDTDTGEVVGKSVVWLTNGKLGWRTPTRILRRESKSGFVVESIEGFFERNPEFDAQAQALVMDI